MVTKNFKTAGRLLKLGQVIAFPTETVFGLGALLSRPQGIKKIYKLKNRPRSKPLQVLVASLSQAKQLGIFNHVALSIAKKGWPGPLTLVVYKTRLVPKIVTGGTNKVGLRIPKHRTILELIRKCGPIVATSANEAGKNPALSAKEVKFLLPGLAFILPGRVKTKKASKVIDATSQPKLLRP
jgi:L-threonylcarbamoyladenylate synthase